MDKELEKTTYSYNQWADQYAERNWTLDLPTQRQRFLSLLPSGDQPILDLGCGPGRDSHLFAQAGYRCIGADLSEGMLGEARRRVPESQFVQANMVQLPFAEASFRGLWVCASFLHLPKRLAGPALAEMRRVLIPGGVLFLGVKRGVDEEWVASPGNNPPRLFAYYLPSELRNLVAEYGFALRGLSEDIATQGCSVPGQPTRWINLYALRGEDGDNAS